MRAANTLHASPAAPAAPAGILPPLENVRATYEKEGEKRGEEEGGRRRGQRSEDIYIVRRTTHGL